MALTDGVRAMAAGTFDVARQRLELATLDIEEQGVRAGAMLAMLLAAVALGTLALVALGAAVVVLVWDAWRIPALLGLAALFAAAAVLVARRLSRAIAARPPVLASTLEELRKDGDQLAGRP